MKIDRIFRSLYDLKEWLKEVNFESGSPEAFDEWLYTYFDNGNTITVHGEKYDYFTCMELI